MVLGGQTVCEWDTVRKIRERHRSFQLGGLNSVLLHLYSEPPLGTSSHLWSLYEVNQLGLIIPNLKGARGASGPSEVCCCGPCF